LPSLRVWIIIVYPVREFLHEVLMPITLLIDNSRLSLLENNTPYFSRVLKDADLTRLTGFGESYSALISKKENRTELLTLGRELFTWLDGETSSLAGAIQNCTPPFVLEVTCLSRSPSPLEAAVLEAPWELLADAGGFLAEDVGLGFSPVRRLQRAQTLPSLDTYRLGVVFMAASPRGVDMLDYEAEEAAILRAVGEQHIDLVVEESGELDELGHKLAGLTPMTVLHLSCHGNNKPQPFLALEDEKGDCKPAQGADLTKKLRATMPRLLFLSACLTAAQQPGTPEKGPVQSLAASMARAGLPAVLGWNGSVGDAAAPLFAKELYTALADRQSLEEALFNARNCLLENRELVPNDWHLARLWLGGQGGGVVVGGMVERSLLPAAHGHKAFLDRKQAVPVASHAMFVGRRRELKEGLRVLGNGDKAGLLLLGMGRLGKSSLAARLADRRRDLALAVVFGAFPGAAAILDALAEALGDCLEAQDIIKKHQARVLQDPMALEPALRELICADKAPCRQDKPVLLVLDDLEQILEAPIGGEGPHRVKPEYSSVLQAVLKAFDPHLTKSRLVFTSRYAFGLGGLEDRLHTIQLAAFRDEEQRKLLLHQRSAAGLKQNDAEDRGALVQRALDVSRGNPGLQDLLVGKFVLNPAVPQERANRALDQMEAYLAGGALPQEEKSRRFLEEIALDALIALAGETDKAFLRAATLFEVPVPESILTLLVDKVARGNMARLRGLGLLEPYEDCVNPTVTALAVNALAATRLPPLTEAEARGVAPIVAQALFEAWGGTDREGKPTRTDMELFRLGLLSEQAAIVAACGGYALKALVPRIGNPRTAALGLAALALCQEQGIEAPVMMLRLTAQACFAAGEVEQAIAVLTSLDDRLEQAQANGEHVDVFDAMAPHFEIGKILHTRGRLEEAEHRFRRMHDLAATAGLDREKVLALGNIADILQARGQLDEAMRIRQEQELPVYQKLGDVRSVAVCQGNIADILQARGQLDEAMRIRQEQELPVYEKLGNVRELAVCQGKIADILKARGQLDEAMRIRQEQELPVYEKLGDVRELAVCQGNIADILQARGQLDEAMRIRQEQELPVYQKLGDVRSVAVTQGQIADILQARGQLDEAMRIRQELQLPVYEKLGDVREMAVTQGKIADILQARGQLDEAMRIRQELQLPVYEKLGDVRSVAVCQGKIANILQARGQLDEAMERLQQHALPTFERLGDRDSIAATLWGIAQIQIAQDNLEAAAPKIVEAYSLVSEMGRLEGIAFIGQIFGQLLIAHGHPEEGLIVLQRSIDGFRQLGREDNAHQTEEILTAAKEYIANQPNVEEEAD